MYFPSLPLNPQSTTPIKGGAVRLKRRIGASWAGRILNDHSPTGPAFNSMGKIIMRGDDIIRSQKTRDKVANFSLAVDDHVLVVYNDYSALLVQASQRGRARVFADSHLEVLPLPLYLPKTFRINDRGHAFSVQDWADPAEIPGMPLETGRAIVAQLVTDCTFWVTLARTIGPLSRTPSDTRACAWFSPLKTFTQEDLALIGPVLKALELMGDTPLEIKGRTVDATGTLSSLTINPIGPSFFWTITRLRLAESTFDTFPVPAIRQVNQGYIANRKTQITSFGPQTLLRSTQVTKPTSAHDIFTLMNTAKPFIPQDLIEKDAT